MVATSVPYGVVMLDRHETRTLTRRLLAEARAAGEVLPWAAGAEVDAACSRLGERLGVRVTVVAADGRVLGESSRPSASVGNHADRPEIRAAFAEGSGRSVRGSETVGKRLLYAAWRENGSGGVRVVRLALPVTTVGESLAYVQRSLLVGILVAALLGLGAAFLLSRGMLRRIERLVGFARDLADGGPALPLVAQRADDLGILEAQVGEMARSIAATIEELRVERERLEAILRGMVEGVVVTDLAGEVVLTNRRACELLDLPAGFDGRGRALMEVTREPALADIARELAGGTPVVSRDVTLAGAARVLQVNGARLRAVDGEAFGLVLVLHDVTELRRLEVVRRDFVVNVSHELRTPLTAIKGYAETLLGPAGDDRGTARRFLDVIDRHSERLGRLIEDLLALSDLELGRTPLRLAPVALEPVVEDVLQMLSERLGTLRVSAEVAPGTPSILADADRVRQVLINLIDNAVKYTRAGGRLRVRAALAPGPVHAGMVEIAVEDSGIGISAHDIPRLTERFFRVDKARSRELGGTGLGLAIVKHIMQAHGGALVITSALGEGTTARVFFPSAEVPVAAAIPSVRSGRSAE